MFHKGNSIFLIFADCGRFATPIQHRSTILMQDEYGFRYHKAHSKKEGDFWRCTKKNKGCKASIVTLKEGNLILRQNYQHNHIPE